MARRYYSSTAARTTLASGVDDSTTTFSVTAVSGWPASYPYTLVIDQDTVNEELVEVSARNGTTLTVTRGVDGTSAVAHDSGAAVNHGVSARDFDEPNAFINGTGVVTSTMILDGTIANADINASAAIAQSKIADLTSDLASKLDTTAYTPGLHYINSFSAASVSNVSINNVFSTTYENYRIVGNILGSNTTIATTSFRLRKSGTDNTASEYDGWEVYSTDAAGPLSSYTAATTSASLLYQGAGFGAFTIDVFRPGEASQITFIQTVSTAFAATTPATKMANWRHEVTDSYDGFTLISGSGTISIRLHVYGYEGTLS